jgi:small GTP-binding protein
MAQATTLKITLLGEPAVGKTSIINRFINGAFDGAYSATIGFSFLARTITVNSEPCVLNVWDTSGSERYRSVAPTYYRGSDACLLVYDLSRPATLQALAYWYEEFASFAGGGASVPVALLGNKADLPYEEATIASALALKDTHNFTDHYTASALTGDNIENPFFRLAQLCMAACGDDVSSVIVLPTPRGAAPEGKRDCC